MASREALGKKPTRGRSKVGSVSISQPRSGGSLLATGLRDCCPALSASKTPLLGKGGVAARSNKYCEATSLRADGVVRSTTSRTIKICGDIEPTTPSAPIKGCFAIFLDGAATPPLPRRGVLLPSTLGNNPLSRGNVHARASG